MQFITDNWVAIVAVVGASLGLAASVAHLTKNTVDDKIVAIATDVFNKLSGSQAPAAK